MLPEVAEAVIMAIADMYDSLTSQRCYKDAFSHENALEILNQGRGSHFAPDVLAAFGVREEDVSNISKQIQQDAMRQSLGLIKLSAVSID